MAKNNILKPQSESLKKYIYFPSRAIWSTFQELCQLLELVAPYRHDRVFFQGVGGAIY